MQTRCRRSGPGWHWPLTIIGLLLATLGAGPGHAEGPVTIRAQGIPDLTSTAVNALAQRAVMRAFLEREPDIIVERFAMPQIEGAAMDSGPLMAIAAGIPPHAIYVNFRQSSTYVAQGFLEPLEVLLARTLSENELVRETDDNDEWLADPTAAEIDNALQLIRERTPDVAWDVVYRQNDLIQDVEDRRKHVWALPTGILVQALMYRKDLFYAAGLNPEQPPQDWDELLEFARRMTIPERQQYGMAITGGQALSWGVYTFLVSNGARAVTQNAEGQWQAAYGSQEAAEAMEFVWRLVAQPFERDGQIISGAARVGTNELSLMWDRGQIGMRFSYLDDEMMSNINPQLVGLAAVPASHRGTRGSEVNCPMMGVFTGSTPRQKLAVMRYIWFITSPEAQRMRTRVFVNNGYGPFVSPDRLIDAGYPQIVEQMPAGWKEAYDTAMANGVPEPYGHNTQHIYRYMSEPIYAALELNLAGVPTEQAVERILPLMQASAEHANLKLLGNIPPEEMRTRRMVAAVVVAVVVVVFCWGMVLMWRYFSQAGTTSKPVGGRRRRLLGGLAMVAPALGLTVLWLYLPLSGGLVMAFMDYRLAIDSTFVGLDNFANVLYDENFWESLGRTFYFVALMIGLGFWPPILLAILLDEVPTSPLKYLYRTLFYLPAIISGVIIMFLWKQLYDPSAYGVLNRLLLSLNLLGPVAATILKLVVAGLWVSMIATLFWLPIKVDDMSRVMKAGLWAMGSVCVAGTLWKLTAGGGGIGTVVGAYQLQPLRWIDSPQLAMLCVVLPTVWAGAGPGCLLYLAALQTVPGDLYEAADLDGASPWHKVFYITLPRLKFLIGIQFIAAVVGAFKGGTDYILALTGGGPNGATTILALEIFIRTFMDLSFGIGTAMAWLLGVLLVGFTAYQMRMLSRADFEAAPAKKG